MNMRGSGLFPRPHLTPELRTTLVAAREEVLDQMLRGLRWVALGALIIYTLTAYIYNTWLAALLYGAVFLVLLGLAAARGMALRWRGGIFVGLLYVVALMGLFTAGLGGAAPAFLLAFAVLTTVFFGTRAGLWASAGSLLTWFGVGAAFSLLNLEPPAAPSSAQWLDWISIGVALFIIMIALILPQRQFLETQAFAVATSQQKYELEQAQRDLQRQTKELEAASRDLSEANLELTLKSRALERRAAQLSVSAEVARVAATLHDLPTLLDTAVHLISERFGFYHAGIFLLDEDGEWAVLRAANSEGGQRMLARGHRLRVGQQGIVGFVTGTGQPRIALSVGEDAVHFRNPDLPETQSEMAIPMRRRDVIMGALDVQSTQVNAFSDDDINALQTLADQLAVAIDNARLFQETQRNLEELRLLQREARQSPHVPGAALPLAYRYDGVDTAPIPPEDMLPEPGALEIPIRVGDDTLGTLALTSPTGAWSTNDRQLMEAVAERMGLALENARLFFEAKTNAQRMASLSEAALELTGPQFSLPDLHALIARRARQLLRADSADLWLATDNGQAIELVASYPALGAPLVGRRLKANEGLAGRAFASGQSAQLDDYHTQPGQLSALAVPMTWQNETLGVLSVNRLQPDWRYTAEDETVARLFAAAAASALSNARLLQETRRRIEELETINSIGTIVTSQADLYSLLNLVGDKVLEIFGVQSGYVALYDSRTNLIEFPYGMDNGNFRPVPPVPLGRGPTSHVIQTRQPLLMNHDTVRRMQDLGAQVMGNPALSFLAVPILVGEDVTGVISVQSTTQEGLFSDDDVRLLSIIATNVGVAIENARLFRQTQNALAETEVLYQATADLNTAQHLPELIESLRRHTLLREAQTILLYYFDRPWTSKQMPIESTVLAHWGALGQEIGEQSRLIQPWMSHVLRPDAPTLVEDIANDPRFDDNSRAVFLIRYNAQSTLFVPLVVSGEWVGYLNALYGSFTTFPEAEVRRLMSLAQQAAVLVENFRSVSLIERRAQQLLTAAEVSRAATSLLDEGELIQRAVELIRERFNLYYVGLFLMDETRQWAVLQHASGGAPDAAALLLRQRHQLEVGGNSMVGWAIAHRRARISEDVAEETVRYANPLTPETRSEMALPLIIAESVLGAISVQSTQRNAFTEADIAVLQTIADQIAASLQNAQLFRRVQRQEFNASALARMAQAVSGKLEETEVWEVLASELLDTFAADGVVIYEWDDVAQVFTPRVVLCEPEAAEALNWPAPDTPISVRLRLDLLETARSSEVKVRRLGLVGKNEVRESLSMSVFIENRVDSLVEMVHTGAARGVSDDDVRLFQSAVSAAAAALQIARLYALQRETAERLEEVDRLKTQFLANMSHELRTPLNSIIGFSRVILKGIDGPITENQRQDLTSIYSSGQHLLGLINDILDVSRIEAGKMELTFEEVHLMEIFEGVLATTRGLIKDKPIQLHTQVPENLPTVRADATRVRQVLLNLLSNAAKFTDKGQITLSARLVEEGLGLGFVEISVADTGHGIPLDHMPRLFERFSQVDGSPTRRAGGTGLGLNISRHLVELHGGRIWAESDGLRDHGSVFRFTLPLWRKTLPEPGEGDGRRPVILVVEDDPGISILYRRYLEPHGFRLVAVTRSVEALTQALQTNPSAILLDVFMPERDGWQVLRDLKQHPNTRGIPVIMCTIADERDRALQLGAADYLIKPILEHDLTRALEKLPGLIKVNGVAGG